jgi:nucleoside-diphosphate-sugar epimerase
MAEYLITGGAGFIGSNIAEYLLRIGKSVRIFDNFSTGKRENVVAGAELMEGDLRMIESVRRVIAGVRYVLHVGAIPSVPRSVEDPVTTNQVNVTGTLNMLVAAREAGVQRVIFSSSSSVYGDTAVLPKREDMPASPLSPYAVQKLTGEYYCQIFWQLHGLETVSLRYFNVFGPRQDPQSQYAAVIPRFITAMLTGKSPTIFGDGKQTRDFSHVQNVIEANLAACEAGKEALGETFNIACGNRISLLDLVATINRITGKDIAPEYSPPRPGDIRDSQADIKKARKLLGWGPSVDFHTGIERVVSWFREQMGR